MKAIAAMAENRAIGKNNELPWPSIKEDFKFFKEFTMNKVLIVGANTFNKLPLLFGRRLLVIHKGARKGNNYWNPATNVAVYYTDYEVASTLDLLYKNELVVIGGAKTYQTFLPHITEFYVTHVKGTYDADTFMPLFEHLFTKQELVKEFEGGHKVIKYFKS